MRIAFRQALACSLFSLLLGLASAAQAIAQTTEADKKNATSFIDSMAETVYKLAWPTATYRSVSYDSIEPASNGFDVIVKLSGISAFDNSELWLKLAFMFRDGKFYDIKVRDDNAFLFRPFASTAAMAKAAATLAKDYADQQQRTEPVAPSPEPPQPQTPSDAQPYAPPDTSRAAPKSADPTPTNNPASMLAEGVCLLNRTDGDIAFEYRWGYGQWTQAHLLPARQKELWWRRKTDAPPSPPLLVRLEDDSVSPPAQRVYRLDLAPTTDPPACDKLENYHFGADGTRMAVYTGTH